MRESKLAGLSPTKPHTPNRSNTTNTTNTSNTGNTGNTGKIKLSIYIDKNLLGRAKTAYLLDQLDIPCSWSEWVSKQIEKTVLASEQKHNHGQPHQPTKGKLPTGTRNQ